MKKTITAIITAALCLPLLSGCGKWLDVKPYDEIAEDDLLSTQDGFMRLLNGIYIELNDDMLYGGAMTVEMIEIMGGAYTIGSDNSIWGNYNDIASYEYDTDYWRTRFSETWNKAYSDRRQAGAFHRRQLLYRQGRSACIEGNAPFRHAPSVRSSVFKKSWGYQHSILYKVHSHTGRSTAGIGDC